MQEVLMILLIAAPAAAAGWFGRERWGGGEHATALSEENARLTAQMGGMQERIAVLERIATDPGTQIAREIAALN